MGIPSQQIGWNTESKLLYEIGKQLSRLIQLTRPRVIYLSESDLLSLATNSGLTIGQLYYDNDRDWLLIADSTSVLKSASGALKIMNGDTLPANIQPDVLLIDTGVLNTDISSATGAPVNISIPTGYLYYKAIMYFGVTTGEIFGEYLFGVPIDTIDVDSGSPQIAVLNHSQNYYVGTTIISMAGVDEDNTVQMILEFHRSVI